MRSLEKHAGTVSVKNSMESIGRSYRKEVKRIFLRAQRRQPSLKWKELKDKTVKQKRKLGLSEIRANRPLDRTRNLRFGMTRKNHGDNISDVTHKSGQFGSLNDYGIFHDNTEDERKKLSLRNFSIPSESTFGVFLRIIEEDVKAQLEFLKIDVT